MASYVLTYDSRRWVRSDSTDTTVVLPVVAGGSGTTTATGTAGSVVLSISPALTGTPTTPTAAAATNTTQIASTAFVQSTFTASGTISNKTIDNTNTITVKDANFTLQDDGGVTRQAQFQLSGVTAGQTRVMTVPDANTTLPVATQVLTYSGPTAGRTVTYPDANFSAARIDAAQTFTGTMTLVNALIQPYNTGTFTIPTANYSAMADNLTLTGSQVVTVSGTGVLRIN